MLIYNYICKYKYIIDENGFFGNQLSFVAFNYLHLIIYKFTKAN